MKRVILVCILAFSLILSTILPSASFANVETVYSDIALNHWAEKYIIKMNLQEVVNGYRDNTFKPSLGIKQVEAVSMLVRLLGYEDEAESIRTLEVNEENELFGYLHNVQDWARGYVLVAARLGLISNVSAAGFNPTEDASRAWMTKLLVTAIQKHGSLPSSMNSSTFTDESSIPSWAKAEVQLAAGANILTGYPDGTFKPTRTVTRAEMTSLLYKAEEYINDSYLPYVTRGTIEVKQDDSIIVVDEEDDLKRFTITDETVLFQGNDQITFAQLRTSDQVSILERDRKILFLDLLSVTERKANELEGRVYLNDLSQNLLTIEDDKKSLLSYKVSSDVIVQKGSNVVNINDIKLYDKVNLVVEENEIIEIKVIDPYLSQKQAEVISKNEKEKIITARFDDNTYEVISLNSQVKLLDQLNGTIGIEHLVVGEKVTVGYEQGQISFIQLPISYLDGYTVSKISSQLLTLSKDGETHDYDYHSNMKVNVKGYISATLSDIQVGDRIKAKVHQGIITEIEIENKERKLYVLDSKDTAARALRVKEVTNNQLSYITYDSSLEIYQDYEKLDSISKIYQNDRILVTVRDGKAVIVNKADVSHWEIVQINNEEKTLLLKGQNNRQHNFKYSDLTNILVNNTTSHLSNFSVGDRIMIYFIGDEVVELRK